MLLYTVCSYFTPYHYHQFIVLGSERSRFTRPTHHTVCNGINTVHKREADFTNMMRDLRILLLFLTRHSLLVKGLDLFTYSRRDAFVTVAATASFTSAVVPPAFATAGAQQQPPTSFLRGIVTLPADTVESPDALTTPALYITCRPAASDNVPVAILSGTRGKAPPVLAARFENPRFPFQFTLTSDNLTGEGATGEWWMKTDLIVSARWDSDGVAATRSPEDLVGRGLFQPGSTTAVTAIPLQGRGAFGKFATAKQATR